MVTNPLLPVIDYTSRDYESIRLDMIRLIRSRIPQWTAENPNDFGVALVEAFAYGVDTLHYYLDRIANEAYLSTAVQRESLYSISDMFNYTPRGATPSSVSLTFSNATQTDVVIPSLTRVQASVPGGDGLIVRNFETEREVTVPAGTPTESTKLTGVKAIEGRTYIDETLGVSNGFVRQQFLMPRTSVLPGTVVITTQLGDSTIEWQEVSDLQNANPTEKAFQILRLTDGSSMVRFGDGMHGDIPGLHAIVRATYRVGGGTAGNVPASSINTIVQPVLYGITVTNPLPASGGLNAESLDSIRLNAARSFRSRDRAVTLSDYVAVAESSVGIAKAKGVGNNGASVTVYVSPTDDGTGQPTLSQEQDDSVTQYLLDRSMAGVTVQVFGAAFTQFYIDLDAYVESTAYTDTVEAAIRDTLAYEYRFDNVGFDQIVTVQEMYSLLSSIEGLRYVEINGISVSYPATEITAIDFDAVAVNAIPFFDPSDGPDGSMTITMHGGIS
jgi:uncharacterized phage protein gp47/JayE